MERTIISWNVPNLISVPLMAFGTFLVAAVVWQLAKKFLANNTPDNGSANNAGGF